MGMHAVICLSRAAVGCAFKLSFSGDKKAVCVCVWFHPTDCNTAGAWVHTAEAGSHPAANQLLL